MIIHAVQYVPDCVEGYVPLRAEVESLEALLAVPWIAGRATDPRLTFRGWRLADDTLIAEFDQGASRIVAQLTSDTPLPMPD